MNRTFIVFSLIFTIFGSTCFASIPDANIVKDRWEVSGLAGMGTLSFPGTGDPDIKYEWLSFELDYASNDEVGIGFGYWKQSYLDPLQFGSDLDRFFLLLTGFGLLPRYINYAADIHFRSQLFSEDKGAMLDASWIYGLGIVNGQSISNVTMDYILPEVGVGFAKRFMNDVLAVRLNLVTGLPAGAEIAIKPMQNLEFTLGTNYIFNTKIIF